MKVLVINDFARKGGAEEVYRTSVDVLRAQPGVDVATFDESAFGGASNGAARAWNAPAARALAAALEREAPQRVLVHNYHNLLSPSVVPVIARYKRRAGCRVYLTCHDYHLVFYNPNLLTYPGGRATPLPLDALARGTRLFERASPRGALHDAIKKLHWHAIDTLVQPAGVFDLLLCPSPYMRDALAQRGITRTALLHNPVSTALTPREPKCVNREKLDLAFVGRIDPEKGLDEFLDRARASRFDRIASVTVYGDGGQRAALERKYADLIAAGQLRFVGRLDHAQLFVALREHDALVLPSVWAENAPLVIVEAAMIGLPVLVHDVGSLSSFGDEIGNKIRYTRNATSLAHALDALRAHLRDPPRRYDWSFYTRRHYAERLTALLQLSADEIRELAPQCD
ncbi:glycosyltransferase family 4 protein [Burkholderia mayonis]|uniref:Glycosyl transferase n=1 Tax=Burkholderia mayonis TaxID=1385591 RepID=A0A1B4G5T1_9BURK|nr:glycosyltransferase family 4 protein [Burkholderia mayonis]AOJ11277.1 glycosyl transferase [Burkholderia mayonis]KVE46252.1 glycosyl transferase [Burkholderia mayonis]